MIFFMGQYYWCSFVHLQNAPKHDKAHLAYQIISVGNYLMVGGKKNNVSK